MSKIFKAKQSISIDAPRSKVWDALINPEMIKRYFFGIEVRCDWKEGSYIFYRGSWRGQRFAERGNIVNIEPEEYLLINFWHAGSFLPDYLQNYKVLSYILSGKRSATKLTILQEFNDSKEEAMRANENWKTVLESLKMLLEKSGQTALI